MNRGVTENNKRFGALLVFFLLVFLSGMLLFVHSYKNLNRSIQEERVRSVQQLGALISGKVTMLRTYYADETMLLADILENAAITEWAQLQTLFSGSRDLVLVTDSGQFLSTDGSRWLIDDNELRRNVVEGNGVMSSFSTVQTKGDYWLFSVGVEDVALEDVTIVGLVKMIDANEYADVATISLYDGLGASYVVDADGMILMRPQTATANQLFNGYNLFSILEKENVSAAERDRLKAAVRDQTAYQFIANIAGTTWLLQSIPSDAARAIVITVPVSVTARDTYEGMRNVILLIVVIVLSLAALVLLSLFFVMRKNQAVKLNEAKTKAKNEFLDKMSHDIRTPLNAIIGMHELALGSLSDTGVVRDCLQKAKISSEYLVSIINDVLDMSRIESGKMTIASGPFSMSELLEHVRQMESLPARARRLEFAVELKTPIETDFIGDPVRIRQCLVNLVSNALKFTPEGGRVTLTYQAAVEGQTALVTFVVSDTGIGMSQEFLERIFTPFEQEYSSMTSAYVGSGLGLSIVSNLVGLMHGAITVDSSVGKGSVFTIQLPLPVTEKAAASEAPDAEDTLPERLRGKRALLVEDNEINREIGILTLERLGLTVESAENGQAAVDKVLSSPEGYFDIILMDIQMPVMNGLEAAARIRASARPDHGAVPIIALSANAFEEDSQRSLQAGMQAHLAKPIDIKALKTVLKKYIG